MSFIQAYIILFVILILSGICIIQIDNARAERKAERARQARLVRMIETGRRD